MNTPKKRGLNIGLGKMLSQANVHDKLTADLLRLIPLETIEPGVFQPRQDFSEESLQELSKSIQAHGVLQPIIVRQISAQQYAIVAGERRWRAAQLAGLAVIPALVKQTSDQAALAIGLIENIQRESLNVMEEAKALFRLIEEFHLTHDEVAQSIGKSRTMVTNLLRLLQLDDQVKILVERGDLSMGHARSLLALNGLQQRAVAKQIIDRQLSVREAEKLVKKIIADAGKKSNTTISTKINPNLAKLQIELTDYLGAAVQILHQKSGNGKLVINYSDLNVLDGILKKINLSE